MRRYDFLFVSSPFFCGNLMSLVPVTVGLPMRSFVTIDLARVDGNIESLVLEIGFKEPSLFVSFKRRTASPGVTVSGRLTSSKMFLDSLSKETTLIVIGISLLSSFVIIVLNNEFRSKS